MNIAVIFAGGTGQRMNSRTKPKQFLLLHGKPIIIYTLEAFDQHPDVDAIIVVCLKEWIDILYQCIDKFGIGKVRSVVPGGESGQESIRNGIMEAHRRYPDDSVVIVHDGVRPLIDEQTITDCIRSTKERGSAVTVVPATETIVQSDDGVISNIIDRKHCQLARAPQCFRLGDMVAAHERAAADDRQFIDSASLMAHYGHKLYEVEGTQSNIKITTPSDFYIMRAIMDVQESSQIFGL
ncbi:2-C-methyl-D-erythritol 4-phosphate cytidylyltransferase [Bifidobacterium amazonense]|uniref:2-C-methyl-D-erythritol 4-phosphate cytidylyltransferase n=1 Tax=Bifidobacterium amazonense TaxID=2809027 RepID=A0ABS9VU48_9BIFI|nr:2-C-methyl-D-erythritol 4-phosphate cytidylyltransferase [Bifidobacterium amazonense]MCH9275496.1 2-C-methyl-D-erythritol 4-phosphate cytidylyltransferase [Bifidobacterium amazonense]